MNKFDRILIPTILNIIVGLFLVYIIAQYNFTVEYNSLALKIVSLTIISIASLFLVTLSRGFFDIVFYIPIYGILVTGLLSYISYNEIIHAKPTFIELTIATALLLLIVSILPELRRRSKIKKLASSCIKGKKLELYSKKPWKLFDEQPKEYMSILYFDIPELYNCQPSLNSVELKILVEEIFAKNFKTIEKYSGILIRSTEDSMLVAVEPLEQKKIKVPMEPKLYCAYSTLICGLELKQGIEEIKASMNNSSPLIKRLKGRCAVSSGEGLILKHIRNGRFELSLFTNSMSDIAEMLKQSSGDDMLCDTKTYDLCSEYFSAKKIEKDFYSITGLSN